MGLKIIVTGALEGRFIPVFGKLSKLHSTNAFSLAIILGDLFADPSISTPEDEENVDKLIQGHITVGFPTYFTIGKHTLPSKIVEKLESSENEVCPNLYFLGKRSSYKTSEGLQLIALGGQLDPAIQAGLSKDKYLPFHTEDDAKALHDTKRADILITSHWPTLIRSGSKVVLPDNAQTPQTEQYVANLCSELKPRYHFSLSDGLFYEREPFFHLTEDGQPDPAAVTRFISVAPFGNPSKQKWMYAFTIDPNAAPPTIITLGTTASPFTSYSPNAKKRQRDEGQSQTYSRFANGGDNYRPNKKRTRGFRPPPTPQECFFCLSNPNLATHLITSIGTDVYLTIAKGPLPTSSTFPNLGCPAHILIIPLEHSPTFGAIAEPKTGASTYKEMQRYRRSLHSLLIDKCKATLGAVTFEISRAEGVHIHWQFMPVPADLIQKGLVEAAFRVEAENEKYPTFKTKEIGSGTAEKTDYFRVWIWRPEEGGDGSGADAANGAHASSEDEIGETRGKEISLFMPLPSQLRFDLQFGRRVIAKLLGLEKRTFWRDCAQTEAEEVKDADTFKAAFKKHDFSLEE
ncbi:MAG: hypothetical protein Q9191_002157 [Dirinaria sp. TL-2023a]